MNNIFVVIAAKNEFGSIGLIVDYIVKNYGFHVIVIDDGSNDGTGEAAKLFGAHVIRHDTTLGIASSLMDGWKMAYQKGAEYVVQMDAGNSHDYKQAKDMVLYTIENNTDLLIGSRFCNGSIYYGRKWRQIMSRLASTLMNFVAHSKIRDWSSGYRVFSRHAITTLLFNKYWTKMHAWQMETLAWAILGNLKIKEYPITYHAGQSSLRWNVIDESICVWLWRLFK